MGIVADLLLQNFTTICLAAGLGILVLTNRYLDEQTDRSFLLVILIVLVLVTAEITDSYLMTLSEPTMLHYLSSAVGYTLRPATLVIFIDILLRRNRTSLALWIPDVFVGIVAFTSYFTHVMFWFGDYNQFIRGPLSYLSHIVSALYLIVLVILMISMHRHIAASEVFAVSYIAFICIFATVLETEFSGYGFLLTGAMMAACALYYIVLYVETYKRDPLTGLLNRRSFYLDAKRMHNKPLVLISIDLNGLKDINDSSGHRAGDEALQGVGKALRVKSGKDFRTYRVGGDEFMAFGEKQAPAAVDAYIRDMQSSLEADGLMAAFGSATYSPGDSFDDICNQADTRMYDDKSRYKHRTSTRGQS